MVSVDLQVENGIKAISEILGWKIGSIRIHFEYKILYGISKRPGLELFHRQNVFNKTIYGLWVVSKPGLLDQICHRHNLGPTYIVPLCEIQQYAESAYKTRTEKVLANQRVSSKIQLK